MNTYDEKNSQDNLYYSVLIETNEKVGKTKNNRLICVLDRTKNTVINEIIIPYINFQKWNKEDAEYLIGELNKLSDENDKLKQQIQVYEKSLIRKSKKISEQQVTIEEQNKEIEEWEFSFRTEMAHHRVAEKELQREQQTTISTLKEENEELHYKLQQTKELLKLEVMTLTEFLFFHAK